jgi:hypothetical protein
MIRGFPLESVTEPLVNERSCEMVVKSSQIVTRSIRRVISSFNQVLNLIVILYNRSKRRISVGYAT